MTNLAYLFALIAVYFHHNQLSLVHISNFRLITQSKRFVSCNYLTFPQNSPIFFYNYVSSNYVTKIITIYITNVNTVEYYKYPITT